MCNYFGTCGSGHDRGYISPMLEENKAHDDIQKSPAYQRWLMEASQDISVKSKPKYPDTWLTQEKIDRLDKSDICPTKKWYIRPLAFLLGSFFGFSIFYIVYQAIKLITFYYGQHAINSAIRG